MSELRRAQVFRAATEVIARETFSGTTIKKVADAAGVSTGTVNHYFANKRAMLIETLEHMGTEWNNDLRRTVDQAAPGWDRLNALMDSAVPTSATNRVRWKVWTAAWSEAVASPELRAELRRSRERWISLLAEKLSLINQELDGPDIDALDVACTLTALLNGLIVQMLASDGALDADIPEIVRDHLRRNIGLGARPALAKD